MLFITTTKETALSPFNLAHPVYLCKCSNNHKSMTSSCTYAKPSIKEQNLIEIITILNAVCFRVSAHLCPIGTYMCHYGNLLFFFYNNSNYRNTKRNMESKVQYAYTASPPSYTHLATGQPPAGYPPQPGYTTPQYGAPPPQQKQQRQVVVVGAGQQQPVIVQRVQSYVSQIICAWIVLWFCNWLCGLIAFILAS